MGKDAHISEMLNELGLLTLDERRNLHLIFEIYKTINTDGNQGLKMFFTPVLSVRGHALRAHSNKNVTVPRVRTNMGQCSISYRGLNFWNKLPLEAKLVPKFVSFKRIVSSMVHQLFGDHPT